MDKVKPFVISRDYFPKNIVPCFRACVLEAIPPLWLLFFKVPGVKFVQEKAFELVLVASVIGYCLGPFGCRRLRAPASTCFFFMRWLHLPVLAFFAAASLSLRCLPLACLRCAFIG